MIEIDEERRLKILDEIRDAEFGSVVPSHAFTSKMAAQSWGCADETARRLLVRLVEEGKFMRSKCFKNTSYWYWPVE